MAHYETKQAILDEAGLRLRVLAESLTGTADGSNKVFYTDHQGITDSNDDDQIDNTDVTVYVNGTAAGVAGVDEVTGKITLVAAPANGATVTADYYYSNIADSYLEKVREEAEAWIDSNMDSVDSTPYTTVPAKVRQLTRQYAAAHLLIREYGMNQDVSGTSKDGYKRLELVEAALAKYIAIGGSTGLSSVSAADVEVSAEPDIFSTYSSETGSIKSRDDIFMRDLGVTD
jgi:hypothetical protein